jgi:hypothetical protein
MPAPFPGDALSVFTAWLRTGDMPDPWAMLAAAGVIIRWVATDVQDDDAGGLKGSPVDDFEMDRVALADRLDAQAHEPEGLKAGFPWKMVLQLALQAIQAAMSQL